MTMGITEWAASVLGKSVGPADTNGQCVGLYYDYMQNCLGITPVSTQYGPHAGYAIGTWDSGQPPAGLEAVKGASDIRRGDIVFWNWGAPFTPLSHVAIAAGNNVAGTCGFMSQNSPLPFAVEQQLPLLGVAGLWRPTGLNSPASQDPTGITQSADKTGSSIEGLGKVLGTLSDPGMWKRIGLFAIGVILLLIAFWSFFGEEAVNTISKVASNG